MDARNYIIPPLDPVKSPFTVEVKHYTRHDQMNVKGDFGTSRLTLLLVHGVGLHKECFEPMLKELFARDMESCIFDAWSIDWPNHGHSASLNKDLLRSSPHSKTFNPEHYSESIYSFIMSENIHGVNFASRRLVAIAHSAAAGLVLRLHHNHPTIFRSFILLDPGIAAYEDLEFVVKLLGSRILKQKDTWDSQSSAFAELRAAPPYSRFHPDALASFMKCGLRGTGNGMTELACTKYQQHNFYQSDPVSFASKVFFDLISENTVPFHLILCLDDEYRGKATKMKQFQIDHVRKMRNGTVQCLPRGGHFFCQTEPELSADAILQALKATRSTLDHLSPRL
ncbi:Alpha/Beta hydrolase protein [Collybia nuda]|uniref:Alpha/Beta hydrolase protein n=1 Tax=Collybia nuda TaxID=64659 RepID=A0A9P5Y1D1_9AGAR|nr:Alpha/Beta hydrolase protein [Collybia nuda]